MMDRSKWSKLLVATGVLSLIVAGGVALAQPGSDAGPEQQIVRDKTTIELAWIDADGTTGTETITLNLTDAPDQAASDPSPESVDPQRDPLKS